MGVKVLLGNLGLLSKDIFMIEEKAILEQIQQLPEQLRQEILHYVEFLQAKYSAQNQKAKKRKAGSAKGKYKLASDFDAPLEDFKEYV